MAYLVYGLHHAEGFIIITGEVGAGKTILVDNLLSTIDQSNFIIAKIVTTQLAGDDLAAPGRRRVRDRQGGTGQRFLYCSASTTSCWPSSATADACC